MNYRKGIRLGYLVKTLMWGVVALVFAGPAIKYLTEYGRYIQGGINGFCK